MKSAGPSRPGIEPAADPLGVLAPGRHGPGIVRRPASRTEEAIPSSDVFLTLLPRHHAADSGCGTDDPGTVFRGNIAPLRPVRRPRGEVLVFSRKGPGNRE